MFQVRVEELVIISCKFFRRYDTTSSANGRKIIGNCLSCPIIMQSYSFCFDSYHSLVPLDSSSDEEDMVVLNTCHQCRKMQFKGVLGHLESSSEERDVGNITCQDCQKVLHNSAKPSAQCNCRICRSCGNSLQEALFKFHVERAFDNLHPENGKSKDKDTS